jgi:hypothetical protein
LVADLFVNNLKPGSLPLSTILGIVKTITTTHPVAHLAMYVPMNAVSLLFTRVMISDGSMGPLSNRPIPLGRLRVAAACFLSPFSRAWRARRQTAG